MSKQIDILVSSDELDYGLFNELEREGDSAFDLLRDKLETLPPEHRARALGILLMLCRQFCVTRLPEAVRAGMAATASGDVLVRSAGVRAASRGWRLIPAFRELQRPGISIPSREEVAAALRQGLGRGVSLEAEREAERFFSGPAAPEEDPL